MLRNKVEIDTLIKKHEKESGGPLVLPINEVIEVLKPASILIAKCPDNEEIVTTLKNMLTTQANINILVADAEREGDKDNLFKSTMRIKLGEAGLSKDAIFKAGIAFLVEEGEIKLLRHQALPSSTKFSI